MDVHKLYWMHETKASRIQRLEQRQPGSRRAGTKYDRKRPLSHPDFNSFFSSVFSNAKNFGPFVEKRRESCHVNFCWGVFVVEEVDDGLWTKRCRLELDGHLFLAFLACASMIIR